MAPMDFQLSEEQQMLKKLVRSVADDFKAFVPEWERTGAIPDSAKESMRTALERHGLLGMTVPQNYGGQDRPFIDLVLVIEEFARYTQPLVWYVVGTSGGPVQIIIAFGSERIKNRYLTQLVSGRARCALAMTEPQAGSATTDLQTIAVPGKNGYILNGTKVFVGGAGSDQLYVVFASFDQKAGGRGIGALLLDKDSPGLTFGRDSGLISQRMTTRQEMVFQDCVVPAENLLVQPGHFGKLMGAFNTERIQNSAWSLGLAQGALEETLSYLQRRVQFGKKLVQFQMIQNIVADMVIGIEAGRFLVYRAATSVQAGTAPAYESALAKAFISEAAPRIIDSAIQVHGAYGLTTDLPLERMWRDARGLAIAAGTAQINKIRIVTEITGVKFDQRA